VAAAPIGLQWPQSGGPGADVVITYSYSNLLDGSFLLVTPSELRAATEEALGLWATYAPIHFIEMPDSGPPPSDESYDANGYPQIRIGHHTSSDLAHAYYPGTDGLSGDVHVDSGIPWTLGDGHWNFLEAITHELGHALGLGHELDEPAIMNPFYPQQRFTTLGSAFLFPNDIAALQQIYGAGHGSVQPLAPTPEPATILLVGAGLAALARGRGGRTRRARRGQPFASANRKTAAPERVVLPS